MPYTLDAEQRQNAQTIIAVGEQLGADETEILGALAAGIMESNLRNLNHGDRDSLGVFQQRPSQGWGTIEQVRNVAYAARSFLTRLMGTPDSKPIGERVADVQRPAAKYRGRYAENLDEAASVYFQVEGVHNFINDTYPEPDFTDTVTAAVPEQDLGVAHGVFKAMHDALNGGSLLNPQEAAQTTLARGGTVAVGIGLGVAGMVLIVSSVMGSGSAKAAASVVPGGALVAQAVG